MKHKDAIMLEYLLELDGTRLLIDEVLGLWVKFDIKQAVDRHNGIKYSLSLHNQSNERILGFDNAHAIEYRSKKHVAPQRIYDHWHKDNKDKGRPYNYVSAAKLLEDFWDSVDQIILDIKEEIS